MTVPQSIVVPGDPPRGLEPEPVARWLIEHVPEVTPPLRFALVAAGGSNLTYRVEDSAGRALALRRPPVGRTLASAHDVAREHRILTALAASAVPVPEALAFCDDESITGARFFVMRWIDGRILRTEADGRALDDAACRAATESLVDVQIALHDLDVDAVGLGNLGRRGGYVARQLARWRRQVEAARTRDLPLLAELHDRLEGAIPREQSSAAMLHGDYRFDNTILGNDARIRAVLDWELATLGDPVADFCWSLLYWADPGDEYSFLSSSPTLAPGFVRRADVAEMYARRSGRDLGDLSFHVAFGWWKMACIVEGVYARLQAGAGGGMASEDLPKVAQRVERMLEIGHREASRLR